MLTVLRFTIARGKDCDTQRARAQGGRIQRLSGFIFFTHKHNAYSQDSLHDFRNGFTSSSLLKMTQSQLERELADRMKQDAQDTQDANEERMERVRGGVLSLGFSLSCYECV